MKFASLGSGSKGNATLVESANHCLMVDCGFTVKETERRLQRLGRSASDLDAILVTHEHSDHIKGVMPLARKYRIPVYASHGTAMYQELGEKEYYRPINLHRKWSVGDIEVTPVAVPHDSREPCQFVFRQQGRTFGLLTDLGSITTHVVEHYRDCDALLLECNHDEEMLANGPYPPMLKRRVGGDWGHLSNRQAAGLLSGICRERLQHLVMAHLSEKNNTRALAEQAVAGVLENCELMLSADQEDGIDWLGIN